ncbi:hypothetical protein BJX65DRAFT_33184 [Aspergillus insuetus]
MLTAPATGRSFLSLSNPSFVWNASRISPTPADFGDHSHRVVVVGGGTAGLRRVYVPESSISSLIDNTVSEYDEFLREFRAYTHIDRFCSSHERGYFPHFHGVLANLPRSRFTCRYANPRAIALEALISR